MGVIIDGKALSSNIKEFIKKTTDELINKQYRKPGLAVIIVGNDPASKIYVTNKINACAQVGFYSVCREFSENSTTEEIVKTIETLNKDKNIDGILVQLPLPKHLNTEQILESIDTYKNVDGLSIYHQGLLLEGKPILTPCTPLGILTLLENYGIDIQGKNTVVIGRSKMVGLPVSLLLLSKNATVTICHSKTLNIKEVAKKADIIIAALGRPKFVTADMVKDGVIIIDVGINRGIDGKICGDVDFENVISKASYITPVPGGVGPMTIAMLLSNTLTAYKAKNKLNN